MVIYQPHIYQPQPLGPQKNHNHHFFIQTRQAQNSDNASPKQLRIPLPSKLPVPRATLYLESWHRVCLHIEARIAAFIEGPVVRLLETGHIGVCSYPRAQMKSSCLFPWVPFSSTAGFHLALPDLPPSPFPSLTPTLRGPLNPRKDSLKGLASFSSFCTIHALGPTT
jgi:hypothetical protein